MLMIFSFILIVKQKHFFEQYRTKALKSLCIYCTVSYQDLESVQQRGSVCQAAILLVGGVVLGNVAICSSAEEDFLNAAGEGVAQVLDWVHHDTTVDHRA